MLGLPMKPPGTFKLLGNARRSAADAMDPLALCDDRSDRIVNSLRTQALEDLLATDDIRARVLDQLDRPI
jgi:hypothetical protein